MRAAPLRSAGPAAWAPFGRLRLGPPSALGGLACVPLLDGGAHGAPAPSLDLLTDALATGEARVTELDLAGRVDRLRVVHTGPRPLLALDGEHLVGGKQDRVVDGSALIAPGAAAALAVCCVERGRWQPHAEGGLGLRGAGATLHPSARSEHLARTASQARSGAQESLWRAVDAHITRSGVRTATGALGASHAALLAAHAAAGPDEPWPGQVGLALVDRTGRVLLDVLGSAASLARALPLLLSGARAEPGDDPPTRWAHSAVLTALERLERLPLAPEPVPLGAAWLGVGAEVAARAVALDGAWVHAVATAW